MYEGVCDDAGIYAGLVDFVPAPTRVTFWATLSFATVRLVMMSLILFFTFEPLTPDTHASGDSTQRLQTFTMPSA